MLATFVFNTENIAALICFPIAFGVLFWWAKPKELPPRIEWPRAEDYDIASGRYMNGKGD